jgi:putative transcriptional regulator
MASRKITMKVAPAQFKISAGNVDLKKIKATTEEDIRRHQIEDREDPDAEVSLEAWNPTLAARRHMEMTQEQFATLLKIPVATIRNWEQARVVMDPSSKALMRLLLRLAPKAVKKVLAA